MTTSRTLTLETLKVERACAALVGAILRRKAASSDICL